MRKNMKKCRRQIEIVAADSPDGKLSQESKEILERLFPKNYERVQKFFKPK